jgi:hypothetical protein
MQETFVKIKAMRKMFMPKKKLAKTGKIGDI